MSWGEPPSCGAGSPRLRPRLMAGPKPGAVPKLGATGSRRPGCGVSRRLSSWTRASWSPAAWEQDRACEPAAASKGEHASATGFLEKAAFGPTDHDGKSRAIDPVDRPCVSCRHTGGLTQGNFDANLL